MNDKSIRNSTLAAGPHCSTPDDLDQNFDRLVALMYKLTGVFIREGKESMVRSRLSQRIADLDFGGFSDYLDFIELAAGDQERVDFIDRLTTNKTSFFRETAHFNFLVQGALRELVDIQPRLRIWNAGCSSGQEPYTLAMLLTEELDEHTRSQTRILATDISTPVLQVAATAVYDELELEGLDDQRRRMYLLREPFVGQGRLRFRVDERIREMVSVARLNLMDSWPMRGPFAAIFCRNVMIYFDRPVRERLVQRFRDLLVPGGYLFVGHSEGLNWEYHCMEFVRPATYRRPA